MTPYQTAIDLAMRGLRVFRLRRGTKAHFIDKDWVESATRDLDDIRERFRNNDYNIAVLADGHVVIDVDAHKGGLDSLASFSEVLPRTFKVRTPNGGLHLYFKAPEGVEFSGSVEVLAKGIDVRAHHNYTVGPSSQFEDRLYTVEDDAAIAPVPQWLADRLRAAPTKSADAAKVVGEADTDAALSAAKAFLYGAAPIAVSGAGGNNTTYAVACAVMDKGVLPETALELMEEHYNPRCVPPWDREDLERIVMSAGKNRQAAIGRDNPADGFVPVDVSGLLDPFASRVRPYRATVESDAQIPPRPWIIPGVLIRGNVTVLGAPGATGKSSWALQVAVAIATGEGRIIGREIRERTNVLIINNEDPHDELDRRLAAVFTHFAKLYPDTIKREEAWGRIHLFSGHGNKFRIARRGQRNVITPGELVPFMETYIRKHDIGVTFMDPVVSLHESNENDNTEMQRVMDIFVSICANTNISEGLIHHTSKPDKAASDHYAGNENALRGASAIKDASRVTATMFGMSAKDGERWAEPDGTRIKPEHRHRYVRLDGAKENLTLKKDQPQWFKKVSVQIGAGDGESMGVLEPIELMELPATETKPKKGVSHLPDGRAADFGTNECPNKNAAH